jgi:hypothetical protein
VRLGAIDGARWALDWKPNATVVADGSAWTYVALTWDGATVALHLNGVRVDSRPFANGGALFAGSAPVLLGAAPPLGGDAPRVDSTVERHYAGVMDEVRVWSTALASTVVADTWEGRHGVDVPRDVGPEFPVFGVNVAVALLPRLAPLHEIAIVALDVERVSKRDRAGRVVPDGK